jgi:hypothetical protein
MTTTSHSDLVHELAGLIYQHWVLVPAASEIAEGVQARAAEIRPPLERWPTDPQDADARIAVNDLLYELSHDRHLGVRRRRRCRSGAAPHRRVSAMVGVRCLAGSAPWGSGALSFRA